MAGGVVLEVKQKRRKKGKREKLYLSIPHKKGQEKQTLLPM